MMTDQSIPEMACNALAAAKVEQEENK